jgi:signal transduction histidine kinase
MARLEKISSAFQIFRTGSWLTSLALVEESQSFTVSKTAKWFQAISLICGGLSVAMALLVMFGWYANIPLLKTFIPHLPETKIHTAIAMLCSGITLILTQIKNSPKVLIFIERSLAAFVLVLSVNTIVQYIFHINLNLDQFFLRELITTANPNRMSPQAAMIFCLLSLSLFTIDISLKKRWIFQLFLISAGFFLLPTIVWYVYGVDLIYNSFTTTRIALPATISFVFLIVGTLFARPRRGVMLIVTSSGSSGYLARQALFTAFLTPLILGWAAFLGFRLGFYDSVFGFFLLVCASMVSFPTVIWQSARSLYELDKQRVKTEQKMLFLAEASKVLASSLEYKQTLQGIASLAVPHICDWCSIDILDKDGELQQVAVAHTNPQKVRWAKQYRKKNPPEMTARNSIGRVIKTGKSELHETITDKMLQESIKDPEKLHLIRSLGLSSVMIVPILSQKKVMGALQFISSESGRHFTHDDLVMAEELASRVALAITNAQLYRNAQDAINIRDEFISIASHELKTPLTTIKGYGQLIERLSKKQKDPLLKQYVQKVLTYTDRLNELISDLLDISRIQTGKLQLESTQFEFTEMLKEAIEAAQSLSHKHTIKVENKVKQVIEADRYRIEQVITNLLSNAFKYSPNATRVIVKVEKTDANVIVSIQDFGIGIPKEKQTKIFQRFYRVSSAAKQFAGLGIGLYLSAQIVSRHGGTLWVESEEGKGSTFYFSIPIKK